MRSLHFFYLLSYLFYRIWHRSTDVCQYVTFFLTPLFFFVLLMKLVRAKHPVFIKYFSPVFSVWEEAEGGKELTKFWSPDYLVDGSQFRHHHQTILLVDGGWKMVVYTANTTGSRLRGNYTRTDSTPTSLQSLSALLKLGTVGITQHCKTWLQRPPWIATTCFQRPLFRAQSFVQKRNCTANRDHLCCGTIGRFSSIEWLRDEPTFTFYARRCTTKVYRRAEKCSDGRKVTSVLSFHVCCSWLLLFFCSSSLLSMCMSLSTNVSNLQLETTCLPRPLTFAPSGGTLGRFYCNKIRDMNLDQ